MALTIPKQVLAGTAVRIIVNVFDNTQTPPVLINPTSGPTIYIKRVDGTMAVTAGAMSQTSTGIFYYTYTTLSNDPLGVYKVWFQAVDSGSVISGSIPKQAIQVVAP